MPGGGRELPFRFESAELDAEADPALDWLASFLALHSDFDVSIEGHTDDVGDDDFNQDLSERRARAVVAALVDRGIEVTRLTATGYGERLPKVPARPPRPAPPTAASSCSSAHARLVTATRVG